MICRKSDPDSIQKTASLLKSGGVAILPTDTVYGFSSVVGEGADKIRKIKGRSESKPFIQLISSVENLPLITDDNIPDALLSFWPGPLTIIVNEKSKNSTVAIRCPGDKWIRDVIEAVGKPIYSTSVNRSGNPVLGAEKDIVSEFGDEVDLLVLDGDKMDCVPSTIVSVADGKVSIVREGAVKITNLF